MENLNCGTLYDVCIIGGGPAGLFAAISARNVSPEAKICVIEKNPSPCNKLLITGGGKCNITNISVSVNDFNSEMPSIVHSIINSFSNDLTTKCFRELGLDIIFDESGKGFPSTYKAETVKSVLLNAINANNITLLCNTTVIALEEQESHSWNVMRLNAPPLCSRTVIVSTGGKSFPQTGSDGQFLSYLSSQIGIKVVNPVPALVALKLLKEGHYRNFSKFAGISIVGRLTLKEGKRTIAQSRGKILFTHNGISGPAVLDISGIVLRNIKDSQFTLHLSVADFHDEKEAYQWLIDMRFKYPLRVVKSILRDLLPERLALLVENADACISSLRRDSLHEIASSLANAQLFVDTNIDWKQAEITSGGISLQQLKPRTLESKQFQGLFFCGEILDVDGRVGGYNLQWAWSSGWIAGRSACKYL